MQLSTLQATGTDARPGLRFAAVALLPLLALISGCGMMPPGNPAAGLPAGFNADVAVTDIYPDGRPHGQFHLRITNHGPHALRNVPVRVHCSSARTDKNNGQKSSGGDTKHTFVLNLRPGQSQSFPTGLNLDTNVFRYRVDCRVNPKFLDQHPGNNHRTENFN